MLIYFLKDLLKRRPAHIGSFLPYHTSNISFPDSTYISNFPLNPANFINIRHTNNINGNRIMRSPMNFINRKFSTVTKAVIPESYSDEDIETVESIKILIDKRIRPVIQQDGGDVSFVSYDPSTGL